MIWQEKRLPSEGHEAINYHATEMQFLSEGVAGIQISSRLYLGEKRISGNDRQRRKARRKAPARLKGFLAASI